MSEGSTVKLVKVTINGIEIEVPQGELIVESAKRLGLEIPVFCYHPRMKPVGMCRMCLVEVGFSQPDGSVRMMPKPQAGCTLPASDGMVILTDSEMVHRDRRGVLEFLLVNHPLDCPICDRGGECPLQNNTLAYGPSTSRFIEFKRHLPKAYPLSLYVTLDLERCIQCGRCVRFTEEISGEHELAFRFRGAEMQPSTFQLLDFESKFSGNVIEICPVGALTSSKYRFRARPWDLEASEAICTECSLGCNVWFDKRSNRFVRINGRVNEAVNEEWTCDRGKFGHDYYNSSKRITKPHIRRDGAFHEATWAEAFEAIVSGFDRPGSEIAGLTGTRVANEGLYLFKKLLSSVFGSGNLDHRQADAVEYQSEVSLSELEKAKAIIVFGTDLAAELPISYLRVRKAATRNGSQVALISERAQELDTIAAYVSRVKPDSIVEAAKGLSSGPLEKWIDGSCVIIASAEVPSAAIEHLKSLSSKTGAKLNIWAKGSNDMGAQLIGVLPTENGKPTVGIYEGLANSSIKSLWVVEREVASENGGVSALEQAEFVVFQGTLMNETAGFASVILPMAAPAEQEGTWVNCEGRLQKMSQAIPSIGDSKPAWRIFAEAILRLTPSTPYFNSKEVWDEIKKEVSSFNSIDLDSLPTEGGLIFANEEPVMAGEGS